MWTRRLVRTLTVLLAGLVLLLAVVLTLGWQRRPLPYGTDLRGTAAPAFSLQDQSGNRVALGDLRGKVVLLTFIDSHCTDICPLTAQTLARVQDSLSDRADAVAVVAVNLNPHYNRVQDVLAFSRKVRMDQRWHFLTGSPAELQQVWHDYFVDVAKVSETEVYHNSAVYVIDGRGRQRALFSGVEDSALAQQIVADVRSLL